MKYSASNTPYCLQAQKSIDSAKKSFVMLRNAPRTPSVPQGTVQGANALAQLQVVAYAALALSVAVTVAFVSTMTVIAVRENRRYDRLRDETNDIQDELAICNCSAPPDSSFADDAFEIFSFDDPTKVAGFFAGNLSSGPKTIFTLPNETGQLALFSDVPTIALESDTYVPAIVTQTSWTGVGTAAGSYMRVGDFFMVTITITGLTSSVSMSQSHTLRVSVPQPPPGSFSTNDVHGMMLVNNVASQTLFQGRVLQAGNTAFAVCNNGGTPATATIIQLNFMYNAFP